MRLFLFFFSSNCLSVTDRRRRPLPRSLLPGFGIFAGISLPLTTRGGQVTAVNIGSSQTFCQTAAQMCVRIFER